MPRINIILLDGFDDDEVAINVDGREIYHNTSVSTDMLLGFADSIVIDVSGSSSNIEISIPSQQLMNSTGVNAVQDVFIAFSIVNGAIDMLISEEPLGFA